MNEDRKAEISDKLRMIGQSLVFEGQAKGSYAVAQTGSVIIGLSAIMMNDIETFFFSEICSMYAAKKVMDENEGFTEQVEESMKLWLVAKAEEIKREAGVTVTKKPRKARTKKKPLDDIDLESE